MAGILDILADGIEAEEARKAAQRERTRRARDKQRNVTATLQSRDRNSDDTHGRATRVEDKTSNSEIEPQKEEKKETRERAFDAFWSVYPHKVGKADASKAFSRAMGRVDLETLMAGLHRYIGKTDDRPWCNPSTWLNQDRWTDEPAAPVARAGPAQSARPPQMADIARMYGEKVANGQQEFEDRVGTGAVVSYLSAVRSG
jgi:hypothetical protein